MWGAIDQQPEIAVILGNPHQVFGGEALAQQFRQHGGIAGADGHAECGTAVAQHARQRGGVELFQELSREHVARAVLP